MKAIDGRGLGAGLSGGQGVGKFFFVTLLIANYAAQSWSIFDWTDWRRCSTSLAGLYSQSMHSRPEDGSRSKRGISILVQGASARGDDSLVLDPRGLPLKDEASVERWMDWRTMKTARIGLGLLALGFGLDLYSKLFCNCLLFSN